MSNVSRGGGLDFFRLAAPSAILLAAFALRLYRLDYQSIWWDEGHSIAMARHSLEAIPTLPGMDVHPPLYFYTLHLWMDWAGRSEFALRFLSLLFSLASVALLYRFGKDIGREMGGLALGLLAATIGALSPLHIAYAQEVRMYAMVTCLGLSSVYAFYRVMRRDDRTFWLVYVFATAASLYTHYFVLFLIFFQNVFWLAVTVWRRDKEWYLGLIRWVVAQVMIVALLALQLKIAARQVTAYENVNLSPPTLKTFVLQGWQSFTVGLTIDFEEAMPLMVGFALLLLVGLALHFWRIVRREGRLEALSFWLLWAWFVLPLCAYYLVLQRRASFAPRYLIFVTPALYLLLAYALYILWKAGRRFIWLGGLGTLFVLVAFAVAGWSYYFNPDHLKDDTRGLARFLEAEATETDIVFIDVPHPLDYYYRGQAPASYLFVDIHTVADTLTRLCQGRERLFFVRWRQSDTDPRGAVLFLLDKYGQYQGRRGFRGYDVVWYGLPPEVAFSLAPAFESVPVDFGGRLALVGLAFGGRGQGETSAEDEVAQRSIPAGRKMWVAFQWRVRRAVGEGYKVALYLRDGRGHLVGQADKILLNDRHLRTFGWRPDEVAINVYNLVVAAGTPPGEYLLETSVYSPDTLERLDVLDENGAPQGTTALLGTMQVVRPTTPPQVEALGIQRPLSAPLNEEIELLGYDRGDEDGVVSGGEVWPLALYWRARTEVEGDYLVRLSLRDGAGETWNVLETRPGAGTYPTTAWQKGEILRDWYDPTIAADIPPGDYHLLVSLIEAGAVAGEADLSLVRVEGRARVFEIPPDIQHPQQANLGHRVEFLGYDLNNEQNNERGAEPIKAGHVLRLTLYWRALAEMDISYKVFTHLLDGQNRMWGQKDGVPGRGTMPTTGWIKGEVLADEYQIAVEAQTPAGQYQLEVGMYDGASGERLPVLDEEGNVKDDRVLLTQILVTDFRDED